MSQILNKYVFFMYFMNRLNPRLCVDLDGTLGITPRHLMPRFSNQVRDAFFRLIPVKSLLSYYL